MELNQVFITRVSKFLPNEAVGNEEIEDILGVIGGSPSRTKRIVLRNNGIKKRYYALDRQGKQTHSNAELTAHAVQGLMGQSFGIENIELLCCGTSMPDQILPGHASMVHGLIKGRPMEVVSLSGICGAGIHALKFGYFSLLSGNSENAVCTGSELVSPVMRASNFEGESRSLMELEQFPVLAFEKEFLRWMLSDGAGAVLLQNQPIGEHPLRIDWIEVVSFAHEREVCMYAGALKNDKGELEGWGTFSQEEWIRESVFSIKQDVKLLDKYIVKYAVEKLAEILERRNLDINDIDYFLPHISSEFFRAKIYEKMLEYRLEIPHEKWFTNLSEVGNVGSASIFIILEEFVRSRTLMKGQKILVHVPESGRFSYTYALLTVV